MIKKLLVIFIILDLSIDFPFTQDCSCETNLRSLKEKVEANYAGYFDKVNKGTSSEYNNLLDRLVQKSKFLKEGEDCQVILEEYIDFFKDLHLQLENKYTSNKVDVETRSFPIKNVDAYFGNLNLPETDLQGIWKIGGYELAIIKTKEESRFEALVIQSENEDWKKGMVKMKLNKLSEQLYEIEYITGDFELFKTKGYFFENILDVLSIGIFERVEPQLSKKPDINTYESIFPDQEVEFSFPNDSTAILFISSFRNALEVVVDSLILTYKAELEKRPYWIIDISYNGGGGTGTYRSLLPYISTSKIKRSGSYYRLSRENIEKYKQFLKDNDNLPSNVNAFFSNLVEKGQKNPESWFLEKGKTLTFDKIEPNPKKIGVLVSDKTASSGEFFIMDAIQSKKVTVFGSKTKGVVDYGDGMIHLIGCDSIRVSIPTRRSRYLDKIKYDNIGLPPDVVISEENLFPYLFIMDYFYKNN